MFAKHKYHRKVRDHCRYTGKYRGVPHSFCNLKFNVSNQIAGVFHNGSNHEYHFIINKLEKIIWRRV